MEAGRGLYPGIGATFAAQYVRFVSVNMKPPATKNEKTRRKMENRRPMPCGESQL